VKLTMKLTIDGLLRALRARPQAVAGKSTDAPRGARPYRRPEEPIMQKPSVRGSGR
jgi:hypothetical protein